MQMIFDAIIWTISLLNATLIPTNPKTISSVKCKEFCMKTFQ